MKPKVHYQVQPRETVLPDAQVQREIRNFLQALDSYPARAAKEPSVSFRQHLSSLFAAGNENEDDRRDTRTRRQ